MQDIDAQMKNSALLFTYTHMCKLVQPRRIGHSVRACATASEVVACCFSYNAIRCCCCCVMHSAIVYLFVLCLFCDESARTISVAVTLQNDGDVLWYAFYFARCCTYPAFEETSIVFLIFDKILLSLPMNGDQVCVVRGTNSLYNRCSVTA